MSVGKIQQGGEIPEHFRAQTLVTVSRHFLYLLIFFSHPLCDVLRVGKTAMGSRERKGSRAHAIAENSPPQRSLPAVQGERQLENRAQFLPLPPLV